LANDQVDFEVRTGEIHALLGENGAGKSTLMKILYGLYQPEEGEILLNGQPIQINSPTDSINYGIGMIHQHFMLVNNLTVAENVALGLRQRQRVEIIKALYRGAALLVLDEPTAVLTPQEVDELFIIFRQMAADGHALIFISHKLHEIFALTNKVTVLRDGRVVGTRATADVTKADLAEMMVGRPVSFERDRGKPNLAEVRLELKKVNAVNEQGQPVLRNVDLQVRSGEILGVAGVSGNGQKPLAEAIMGLITVTSGQIDLDGKVVTSLAPSQRIEMGLSYIPEERMHDGVVKDFSVEENLILQDHIWAPFSKGIMLVLKAIVENAKKLIKNFDIRTPSRETLVKSLSGGNIQKVVMARELSRKPRILIAAQPTRGVDIGAIEYIHGQLLEQRAEGLATLLISEDLDEVRNLSDRIAVMFDGEIMGIVDNDKTTVAELGLMMAGEKRE